jgi:hypothetical protein
MIIRLHKPNCDFWTVTTVTQQFSHCEPAVGSNETKTKRRTTVFSSSTTGRFLSAPSQYIVQDSHQQSVNLTRTTLHESIISNTEQHTVGKTSVTRICVVIEVLALDNLWLVVAPSVRKIFVVLGELSLGGVNRWSSGRNDNLFWQQWTAPKIDPNQWINQVLWSTSDLVKHLTSL